MKKIEPLQVIVNLVENDYQKEVSFPDSFKGDIVGYSTIQVGNLPALKRADISLWDGSNQVLKPIDIAVSEVTTKDSVKNAIAPLSVANPGNVRVNITPSAQIGAGEEYSVKVIVWYAVDNDGSNTATSLNECNF